MAVNGYAQLRATSQTMTVPLSGTVNMGAIKEDWNPVLQNVEAPRPASGIAPSELQVIKDSLKMVYGSKAYKNGNKPSVQSAVNAPALGKNFQGNAYSLASPNDNDMAISNGGKIISVANVNVFNYDENTNTPLSTVSLAAFFASLNNSQFKFDPKVIYDPQEDKFILLALAGYTPTTSSIVLGFSQTNDPLGAWNLYQLPGNPLNNNLWTDFPMMALTQQEFFLTINLLQSGQSWQLGFVETLIWQINKKKGFTGQTLLTKLHNNIGYGGKPLRNLCPAKGGSQLYGPNMYFLSNRNFSAQNDSVFLVEVTDTINSGSQQVNVTLLKANQSYFVPPNAAQKGSAEDLATNDGRILSAFIENNTIQFTSNTMDTSTSFAAIYHGVISNVSTSPSLNGTIVGNPQMEYGYANLSYAGFGSGDNNAIITFDHAGPNDYPGMSAIATDGQGGYSQRTMIKDGTNYLNAISGAERWGDYTGSQRRYNQPGTVWMSGFWCNNSKNNQTWIGELKGVYVGVDDFPVKANDVELYPNPVAQEVFVEFVTDERASMTFDIYTVEGRHVKMLLSEMVKAGRNKFSFSTDPLPPGVYFLKISDEGSNAPVVKKFVKL